MTDIPGGPLAIVIIFLIGLGLNLTPCVYPMLSITISLFGTEKHRQEHRAVAFLKACIYVLGISTMYSLLGLSAAFTGEVFGSLLQHKWVLVSIALLLVALSLSMFGFFTFQMPSWLIQRLGAQKRADFIGIYVSGLLVGIFAAPCIGPPVIALLTFVGTRGDPWFGFWVFFVMSLGLGFPYLILGTFSGWIHKLPKSGVWMIWVEHLFGVILLTVAAFYLMTAFKPDFIRWLPALALLGGGVALGFVDKTGEQSVRFTRFKRVAGILALAFGISMIAQGPKQSIAWEPFSSAALEDSKVAGEPVILDFYADWCIPCHELDHYTYTDPHVIETLQSFRKLKIDLTQISSPESVKVIDRFDILGVPTIVFLDPMGQEVPETRIPGFIQPEDLVELIRAFPFFEELT